MTRRVIGLVAPFPPQIGGVASFAEWLLGNEGALDVHFSTFDLRRSIGSGGGFVSSRVIATQVSNLVRFVPWALRSPRLVHYCVAGNTSGLARDCFFVLLLRGLRRSVIAHVHSGTDLETADRSRSYRSMLKLTAASSVETVSLSPSLAGRLESYGIVAGSIMNPAPFGDEEPPERTMPLRPGVPLALLYVGRLEERKGCMELLRAVAAVRTGGVDVQLELVGEERYPGYESELRGVATALGIDDVVRFCGAVTGSALVERYDSADVVCLPSHAEGLPMVVMEAMRRGVAVVASRVGGIPDVVVDGETGLLVAPRDAQALAESIRVAARDRSRLESMGTAGRRRVDELASADVILGQWRALYARRLPGAAGSP